VLSNDLTRHKKVLRAGGKEASRTKNAPREREKEVKGALSLA